MISIALYLIYIIPLETKYQYICKEKTINGVSIKNKKTILLGLVTSLFFFLALKDTIQWLFFNYLTLGKSNLSFSWFGLTINYEFALDDIYFTKIFICLIPLITILIILFLGSRYIIKLGNGIKRFWLISLQIFNTLGLIILIFYDTFLIILKSSRTNDFHQLAIVLGLSYHESIVMMLMIIVLLFTYLNYSARKSFTFLENNK